ncbi:hypothetical protein [Jannaschia aquimarina]|uniref:Uncharacterized protein n=1 Tax=Jannaschia aquimarina TaxID=935700 RepID=A0A0D1END5_9RHOB|nr:hypothetical protein [Jannaschia aquimarina]KIT17190.1 hypothetical protein jaqu_09210 [Jannaschia aquimarina]SNT18123.1 hypothetical protein SAMN05421775_10747 [Jannaschia aquimarina]
MLRVTSSSLKSGAAALIIFATAPPASGHEAWLLTPSEIEALALTPVPFVFASVAVLGPAAGLALLAAAVALALEGRWATIEERASPWLRGLVPSLGAAVLRVGLAAMLLLAATGGLPRHGTAPWTQSTLLVPDMQLSLAPGWDILIVVQVALALILLLGIGTRLAGGVLVLLSGLGLWVFGAEFLSYAPHFAAPGLMLMVIGGGAWSADALMRHDAPDPLTGPAAEALWRGARILVGAGFVYLAVAYKLTQPTLLIAILDHGDFPRFGMTYDVIALIMTGVEIVCGALLVMGRLVRPVALVILGAISFLAVVLGETPLFHANLYGALFVFALAGARAPGPRPSRAAWRMA